MISEIQINPPVATYENPTRLSDLRRINYVFGGNGTGKTTISRVIAQAHDHCRLVWHGGTPLEAMVYNRDFVDRNFNEDGPLRGVFTLGENQVEAEQKIDELKPKIEKSISDISSLNSQLDGEYGQSGKRKELADLESELQKKCWKQKQLHDDYFQFAFTGVRKSTDKFRDKVLAESASNTVELLPLVELKERAETVFSNSVEPASPLGSLAADGLTSAEKNALLQKVIVGDQDVDIAALIGRLGNSDWVKQGLKYHKQDPEICPFCQQATDKHFSDGLAAFFSEAYDNDIQALKQLQAGYQRGAEQLVVAIQRNVELNNPFLNIELYNAEALALAERLSGNQAKLTKKLDEPSRKIELESVELLINQLQKLVDEANEATNQHNQTVDNIATEQDALTAQVWRYVINELAETLQQYQAIKERLTRTIQGMEQSLDENKSRLRDLQNKVKELEKQTTSIQPTVTAINDLLHKFGFHSFSIGDADEGRHYRICLLYTSPSPRDRG